VGMSTLDDNKISVDRRAALRTASAAVVGLTVSTLPSAAAAASGDEVEDLSETTLPTTTTTTIAPQEGTIAAPEPRPPVLTATASMTTLSIGTDKDQPANAGLTYHYQVASAPFVDLSTNSFDVDITSSSTPLTIRVEKRNSSDVLVAASLVTITKVVQTVTTASGGQSLTIANSASGTRGVSVLAVGGRGGRGGHDGARLGGDSALPARVEATYDVPAGAVLVARAGNGGADGEGGTGVAGNQAPVGAKGGAGGGNGLSRTGASGFYLGGRGGNTNSTTRAGGGGGGGAASVLQIGEVSGTPLVVAAGSGGGGGAEASSGTSGDVGLDFVTTPPSPYASNNTGNTDGRAGFDRTQDNGGHGGGGGGFIGGSAISGILALPNRLNPGYGGYTGQSYASSTSGSFVLRGTATMSVDTSDPARAVGLAGFVQLTYWTVAIGPA
jgi:hypothetical protein